MHNLDLFSFLRALKENNNKEWFDKHKSEYEKMKKTYHELASGLLEAMKQKDVSLEGLEVKSCVFRINKDVRFSKDKSPYKTSLGIILTPFGKKMQLAGYYLHLEDEKCFLGGGLYMPPNDMVKKVRSEIINFPEEFLSIIKDKKFVNIFGDLHKSPEIMLSKPPKGMEVSESVSDYVRLKSFTTSRSFPNVEFNSDNFIQNCAGQLMAMKDFIHFINRGLMSDNNGGIW